MSIFVLSFVIVALSMLGIGLGLLLGGEAPSGSCGQLSRLGLKKYCEICEHRKKCRRLEADASGDIG